MKIELFFIVVTGFFIFNTYYDGKYTKIFAKNKKYFQMGFFALVGFAIYLMMKKNPVRSKNILLHANNMIKYMPIDKSSMSMISPILDFTTLGNNGSNHFLGELNDNEENSSQQQQQQATNNYEKRILQSGGKGTKRSVSETKKKYVASIQDWKCKDCKSQLTAWFEVDHIKRLEYGGGNNVENLVALCRDCHGRKTAMENM
jgi:hypothetical protein